jgi:transmembrane sensor
MDQHRFSSLILAKLKNSISVADDQELNEIIKSDQVYANQYRFFMEYWNNQEADQTNSQRLFEDLSSRISAEENKPHKLFKQSARPWRWMAAASVILLLGAGVLLLQNNQGPQKPLLTSSPIVMQGRQIVTLEDGTVIRLNGNSSISSQKMSTGSREVTLVGEAYFSVAKDHTRPFTVHTDQMDISVLGTEFNVRAYPHQQQQTALIQGSIKVTLHNGEHSVIYLKPDDKLTVDQELNKYQLDKIEHYDSADTTAVIETAWMAGHLVFRDQTFEVLAGQLEARFNTPIVFQSEKARKYRFNGTFKKENLQEVLYILSRTGTPFGYQFKAGKVYIN